MTILNKSKTIVLDLDDTLYSEYSYLESAYKYISSKISNEPISLFNIMIEKYHNQEDVFEFLEKRYKVNKTELLNYYRFHMPKVKLYDNVESFLKKFLALYNFSLVTDGRSETQRNKIKALGIEHFLSNIVISDEIGSEKPNPKNFQKAIVGLYSKKNFYIGDNTHKDFVTPNKMGWTTICLKDSGQNIHKQDFSVSDQYLPHYCFKSWSEIQSFFNSQN